MSIWKERYRHCSEAKCDGHDRLENKEKLSYSNIVLSVNDLDQVRNIKICQVEIFVMDNNYVIIALPEMYAKLGISVCSIKSKYAKRHRAYNVGKHLCVGYDRIQYIYGVNRLTKFIENSFFDTSNRKTD